MKLSLYLIKVRDDFAFLLSLRRVRYCSAKCVLGGVAIQGLPRSLSVVISALLCPRFWGQMIPPLRLV